MSHVLERRSYLDPPKPRRRRPVAGSHHLLRLAFPAIWSSPQSPLLPRANHIQRIPEFRGDARIRWILQHSDALAAFDLPSDLATELKVVTLVVYRPRAVRLHEDSAICGRDQL